LFPRTKNKKRPGFFSNDNKTTKKKTKKKTPRTGRKRKGEKGATGASAGGGPVGPRGPPTPRGRGGRPPGGVRAGFFFFVCKPSGAGLFRGGRPPFAQGGGGQKGGGGQGTPTGRGWGGAKHKPGGGPGAGPLCLRFEGGGALACGGAFGGAPAPGWLFSLLQPSFSGGLSFSVVPPNSGFFPDIPGPHGGGPSRVFFSNLD